MSKQDSGYIAPHLFNVEQFTVCYAPVLVNAYGVACEYFGWQRKEFSTQEAACVFGDECKQKKIVSIIVSPRHAMEWNSISNGGA